MRQTAWLTAPLDKDANGRSRAEIARDNGDDLAPLPPNPAQYLTSWLFEIGPTSDGNSLAWSDLAAWQNISGVELRPYEAKLLRRMSSEYAKERFHAGKPDRPMPYNLEREEIEAQRDSVAAKIERLFGSV